jgi:hypothetical protein
MSGFAIIGPQPPPGMLYQQARERALRELQTRANQAAQPCPFCQSGLYADIPDPCPSCGSEKFAPRNSAVLEQRSATRCGMCGSWAWPNCCYFGWQAQG